MEVPASPSMSTVNAERVATAISPKKHTAAVTGHLHAPGGRTCQSLYHAQPVRPVIGTPPASPHPARVMAFQPYAIAVQLH